MKAVDLTASLSMRLFFRKGPVCGYRSDGVKTNVPEVAAKVYLRLRSWGLCSKAFPLFFKGGHKMNKVIRRIPVIRVKYFCLLMPSIHSFFLQIYAEKIRQKKVPLFAGPKILNVI